MLLFCSPTVTGRESKKKKKKFKIASKKQNI